MVLVVSIVTSIQLYALRLLQIGTKEEAGMVSRQAVGQTLGISYGWHMIPGMVKWVHDSPRADTLLHKHASSVVMEPLASIYPTADPTSSIASMHCSYAP